MLFVRLDNLHVSSLKEGLLRDIKRIRESFLVGPQKLGLETDDIAFSHTRYVSGSGSIVVVSLELRGGLAAALDPQQCDRLVKKVAEAIRPYLTRNQRVHVSVLTTACIASAKAIGSGPDHLIVEED